MQLQTCGACQATNLWKPKVYVVGEILVEFHPVANNHLEQVLAREGAEVVMPIHFQGKAAHANPLNTLT